MSEINFNINERVRVRLNDVGRRGLMADHLALFGDDDGYSPPREDADGWSEWQLWDLMQRLGSLCVMGFDPPFETVIQIIVPDKSA